MERKRKCQVILVNLVCFTLGKNVPDIYNRHFYRNNKTKVNVPHIYNRHFYRNNKTKVHVHA